MPGDPDSRPQPVAEAVAAAGAWIGRVWQLALAEGVRNGLDLAATLCDSSAQAARASGDANGGLDADAAIAVAIAELLRDSIRAYALSIEDPPPSWGMPSI